MILKDVSLFDLISAYKKAFESSKEKEFQEIEIQNYRVEDEMENILNRLKFKDSFSFNEILRDYAEKLKIIVAFLAILELAKLKKIKISQNETFVEIFIERALDTQESYANAI